MPPRKQVPAWYGVRVDDTRDRILDAAAAVFGELGARGATTRRIAAAAGVNEVTLFRYFPSKHDLLLAAVRRRHEVAMRFVGATPLPATPGDLRAELRERLLLTHAAFSRSHREVRTALAEWGAEPEIDEALMGTTHAMYDEFTAYLAACQGAGLVRRDVPPAVAAQALLATVFADGVLRPIMPARFPLPPGESVLAYLNIVLDGLLGGGAS